jgi:hypothetical protein
MEFFGEALRSCEWLAVAVREEMDVLHRCTGLLDIWARVMDAYRVSLDDTVEQRVLQLKSLLELGVLIR